jgi:parallel beta-helix repeat protein
LSLNESHGFIIMLKKQLTDLKSWYQISFLLAITLLSISKGKATTYFFSTSLGDDSRTSLQAQNSISPWKTINKLNAFYINLYPGDSVLFMRGDKFFGSIILDKSGSPLAPILIGAYGSGAKPVISGLSDITSWINLNNGIFQTSCASFGNSEYKVIIGGVHYAMGRYPNLGYRTFESHVGPDVIEDYELNASKDWTSAELVIRKNRWTLDRSKIISHAASTLLFAATSTEEPTNGYGYFIQNSIKTLDAFGEWFFDSSQRNMKIYYGSGSPRSHITQISIIDILVNTNGHHYTIFKDVAFEGASTNTFKIINSKNIQIKNCQINLSGRNAISATSSPNLVIENTSINQTLNVGISTDIGCTSATIRYNTIKNTGLIAGMGSSGTGSYEGISAFGDKSLIEYNLIDSIGYNGIYFGGHFSMAKNNLISNFCLTKDDGAGIYVGDWKPWLGKEIVGNIILNGKGTGAGTDKPGNLEAEGIYIDDRTSNVNVSNNSIANCTGAGIKIHNANNINIINNTVYNNGVQLLIAHDNIAPEAVIKNIVAKKNIYFSKAATQLNMKIYSTADDITGFGNLDSNFYCRPLSERSVIQITSNIWSSQSNTRNLALKGWQAVSNQDLNSKRTATAISHAGEIRFEYNFTNELKTIPLKGIYSGIDKKLFSDSLTLTPFSSIILLKSSDSATD